MATEMARRTRTTPLSKLQDEMNQMFGRFFEDWNVWPTEGTLMPPMDVGETDTEILIKAELPGMSAENIDVSVRDNNLVITGEKKESTEERREDYYHVERRYGTFYRSIPLPGHVDADKIEAKCKDGVLHLRLPKAEQEKPRKVKVSDE